MQFLKIVLRESSNRQVLQRTDLAAIAEHMRLGVTPLVTVESSKVLLNCCFEPVNAMRLIDPQNLSTFCSILTGAFDNAARTAVAGIVQSIGSQVMPATGLGTADMPHRPKSFTGTDLHIRSTQMR